jgi:hypothetical protein
MRFTPHVRAEPWSNHWKTKYGVAVDGYGATAVPLIEGVRPRALSTVVVDIAIHYNRPQAQVLVFACHVKYLSPTPSDRCSRFTTERHALRMAAHLPGELFRIAPPTILMHPHSARSRGRLELDSLVGQHGCDAPQCGEEME